MSHLGQLMPSHVPKIEHIEHEESGTIRDKVGQTDGLVECSAKGEGWRHVTDLRSRSVGATAEPAGSVDQFSSPDSRELHQ